MNKNLVAVSLSPLLYLPLLCTFDDDFFVGGEAQQLDHFMNHPLCSSDSISKYQLPSHHAIRDAGTHSFRHT